MVSSSYLRATCLYGEWKLPESSMCLSILMTRTALAVSALVLPAPAQPHDHSVPAPAAAPAEHDGQAMPADPQRAMP